MSAALSSTLLQSLARYHHSQSQVAVGCVLSPQHGMQSQARSQQAAEVVARDAEEAELVRELKEAEEASAAEADASAANEAVRPKIWQ